jgi:hypothetical protein
MVSASDNPVGGAARVCARRSRAGWLLPLLLPVVVACAAWPGPPSGLRVYELPIPDQDERHCGWFGDADGERLYFGVSAFWSASRAAGAATDPTADLQRDGPVLVGRFDLERERMLPALVLAGPAATGPWDVLAHPNGRVYFSRYFGSSGWVEPETGRVRWLPELGAGLNEITTRPDGDLVISRYPITGGLPGSVVRIDPDGRRLDEFVLPAPDGYLAGPKTVAVDPLRGDIWIAMDLLPGESAPAGAPIRHDAYVLDAGGELVLSFDDPELHFPAFAPDGTGYFAVVDLGGLWLRVVPPGADARDPGAGARVLLDPDFPKALDFAQELRPLPGGGALVTRWSGQVHRVDAAGGVRTLRLPALEPGGLYYTAVLRDGRVCATYCADASVVCADAPGGLR